MQELRILELFSGIGGMHSAFKYSSLTGEVIAALDINTVANKVYQYNHPHTKCLNNNIQKLTPNWIAELDINTILMSPPCQPHTRVGQQRDIEDTRSGALNHICALLPDCPGLEFILLENVKGFENSMACDQYKEALSKAGFHYREFILSPRQFGVPNTRYRYYCLAKKNNDFPFQSDKIWNEMPIDQSHHKDILLKDLLELDENRIPTDAYLTEKVLDKRVWLLDVVYKDSTNTMCFTKAYTHYAEGTGSVFCPLNPLEAESVFKDIKLLEERAESSEDASYRRMQLLKKLRLRFFLPLEVARLMSFPTTFGFPQEISNKQKYRLLGNSLNVLVVGELIKLLCCCC